MHIVYCVIGRTCSGKSTLVNQVAKKLGLTVLKYRILNNGDVAMAVDKLVSIIEKIRGKNA